MTITEIETDARKQYNATGDTFWSPSEIAQVIYRACLELARKAFVVERTYTTSTVIDQREYDFPSYVLGIKRVEWNGNKLKKIDFTEDDALTLGNSTTAASGNPQYYAEWNEVLYLRPVPSSVATLKIFAYSEPQQLTGTSSLEVPSRYHTDIVDYVISEMAAKDQNFEMASYYRGMWNDHVKYAVSFERKRKRTDSFAAVKDEESLPITILGAT